MHVFDLVSILAAISHVLANPPHGSKQSAKVVARETSLKLLSMGKTFHDNEKVADECQLPPFMFLFRTSDRPKIIELRAKIVKEKVKALVCRIVINPVIIPSFVPLDLPFAHTRDTEPCILRKDTLDMALDSGSSHPDEQPSPSQPHLAKVWEAARRGGVGGSTSGGSDAGNVGNTQESDAGGEEDENVFVALCNSGVFDAQMDRSVIHDNDEPFSSTSSASNSLNLLPNIPHHLSPLPPMPVWDTSAISPSGHQWLLPPSTPAAAVVVSVAIGATASVGISFRVERITRHADDYFQLGIKSREYYFMGYPPGQRGYRVRSITTNRFFTSGNVIFDENVVYNSIHSIPASTHDYSTLSFPDQSESELPPAPELPINPANLDNLDMTPTSQSPHLDVEPSHSLELSHLFPTCSRDGPRMRKLKGQSFEKKIEAEKVCLEKIREAAARRGGEGNNNPFMALCNSGVTLLSYAEDYDMSIPPSRDWEAEKELGDLKRMRVYGDVDELPEGKEAIGCRWVYEFEMNIYEAHLIAQGLSRVPFVDYGATFAPITKLVTVGFVTVYSGLQSWHLHCFNGGLTLVIFMHHSPRLPPCLWHLLVDDGLGNIYPAAENVTRTYQHPIGSLSFMQLCSCPDISFAVLLLSQFCCAASSTYEVLSFPLWGCGEGMVVRIGGCGLGKGQGRLSVGVRIHMVVQGWPNQLVSEKTKLHCTILHQG